MLIKDLNGIEFSEEELNRYMEIADVSDEKIEKLSDNIKTKLAKDWLKQVYSKILSLLDEDEKIEKEIKGLDKDNTSAVMATAALSRGAFITSYDYAINKIMFITNKRIFIVNTNYYNRDFGYKVYHKDELKRIYNGKSIKGKLTQADKRNLAIAYLVGFVGLIQIRLWFSVLISLYILYMVVVYFIIKSNTKLAASTIFEFKDNSTFELVSNKIDVKEIERYLNL